MESVAMEGAIQNFRPATCLPGVYRCAQTDVLATVSEKTESHTIVLEKAGLIIDLRSDAERNETQAQMWMKETANPPFSVQRNIFSSPTSRNERIVLRLDPLGPTKFMAYLEQNWLTSWETVQMLSFKLFSGEQLHALRMNVLNRKGLHGLNEAILETGGQDLCTGLKAITESLETNNSRPVIVHCVQGKDRTGLLVMLCQSIVGVSDDDITSCYHRSDSAMKKRNAAKLPVQTWGKLDRNVFAAAPKDVMTDTLAMLRERYGSVSPGYLDSIGFDATWRQRLVQVMTLQPRSNL